MCGCVCLRIGAGFEEPAAHQHGAGQWHSEPGFLPWHGAGRPQHDHQQLRPLPQQVRMKADT